jgi:hypothetical protein
MSDTVSGAVILSSIGSEKLTFLSLSDAANIGSLSVVHVAGAAYAEPPSLGLSVNFSMLTPDLDIVTPQADWTDPSVSVSGYAPVASDDASTNVTGAMFQDGT